jgi:hypothetical protein
LADRLDHRNAQQLTDSHSIPYMSIPTSCNNSSIMCVFFETIRRQSFCLWDYLNRNISSVTASTTTRTGQKHLKFVYSPHSPTSYGMAITWRPRLTARKFTN